MTIHIGIIGSRNRTSDEDYKKVYAAFKLQIARRSNRDYRPYKYGDIWIVSGGQKFGADHFAEMIASKEGHVMLTFNAPWESFDRAAGPIRNKFIAEWADVLIACLGEDSKGTIDCINKFKNLKPQNELIIV